MPELADLKALPEIVQVWGGLWLFIAGGVFWLTPKIIAVDNILMSEAENAATAELWMINLHLSRKFIRADLVGSYYLTSASDLRELESLVRSCAAPLTKFAACRKYNEWVKIASGVHAAAWAIWVALILFTEANETITGILLFFGPLVAVLYYAIRAALLRNELHA